MRRFILLLASLLLVLSFSTLAAQDTPTPAPSTTTNSISSLEVVDSLPFVGEELQLDEPIQLFFNRALDCATAASAVSLTPTIAGDVTCNADDSSLTFKPSAPFSRDASYILQLSDALRGQDGAQLAEPYKLNLNTVGFLTVSDVLPRSD